MDLAKVLEALEDSNLPSEAKEHTADCVGFTQGIHDLLVDFKMITTTGKVDVGQLEKYFEAILGELAAASIYLSSFNDVENDLMETHQSLQGRDKIPEIVVDGYKRLATRISRTKERFSDDS